MLPLARLGVSFVAGVATYYFVFLASLTFLSALPGNWLLASVCALAAGIWAGRFTWRLTASAAEDGILVLTFGGALIVGGIAFALGFFGPMIVFPESNQGPLLGILYTGPIGFVAGAIGGFAYALVRRMRRT